MTTYASLATQFYELEKTAQDATREVDFYAAYAARAQGPILEPMCGSGRILIPLWRRGYSVEGFDASASMIEVLRHKFEAELRMPAPVTCCFMQEFESEKKYACIFIPFGSWGLITDRVQRLESLQKLYDYLAPGGVLLIEIDTIYSIERPYNAVRTRTHRYGDAAYITLRCVSSYDSPTQLYQSKSEYALFVDGTVVEREEELFEQYVYRRDEFDEELAAVGFTHVKKYTNYEKREAAADELPPLLVYECSK